MPDPEDIEEYWEAVRPNRTPEVEPVKLVMADIWKLNKDVLCMSLAVMLNKKDPNARLCAEYAAELNRLTKTTLLKLTLLVGVPLEILNGFNSAVKEKKEKASQPEYFPITPNEQVEAARARIGQCNSCGVVTNSPQRLCDSCRRAILRVGQPRRRRSGY